MPRVLPADTWQPEALPTLTSVIRRRFGEIKHAPEQTKVLLKSTAALASLLVKSTLTLRYRHLPSFFLAPKTPFNRPVTAERRYLGVQLSLTLVKAIKNSQKGLTVNDVVLAICAGATRRYLKECGDLPKASLVAMAPVSRRAQDEKALAGNKVSAMLIKLATDVEHPVERLHRIHENAQLAKEYNRDIPIDSLMDLLPVAAPALTLSSFSALKMTRHLPPIFNMVITNVPGSPIPLYFDGAPLQSMSGMVGVYDGMALTFVVMSYLDQLSIGMTTTMEAVIKPELLAQYLQEAAIELASAVLPAGWDAASTACEVIPLKSYAMPRAEVVQMAS
jgi:WS/DGAT/MGAT family acyltransferase